MLWITRAVRTATASLLLAASAQAQTDTGNDFVAGDKVLYTNSFSTITVGMFPRTLRLVEGNAEVAKVDGTSMLRVTSYPTRIDIPLPQLLPERFTIEFDLRGSGWDDELWLVKPESTGFEHVTFGPRDGGVKGEERAFISEVRREDDALEKAIPVKVMADGNYVKVYMNGTRVANVPTAKLGRSNTISLVLYASAENPGLISNLRVAAGGKDLYRALMEDGRMTLEGIEFDVGSDRLRPTSDAALAAASTALKAKPDLTVEVEGHTDNTGSDAANLALSERRAQAVRARLIALGVPAAQLTAKGFGASSPIASNDTAEGQQRNRRVELVRPE
jgi:outer membrane protein OmpA-like peptidoglycan-associated protein